MKLGWYYSRQESIVKLHVSLIVYLNVVTHTLLLNIGVALSEKRTFDLNFYRGLILSIISMLQDFLVRSKGRCVLKHHD